MTLDDLIKKPANGNHKSEAQALAECMYKFAEVVHEYMHTRESGQYGQHTLRRFKTDMNAGISALIRHGEDLIAVDAKALNINI